MKLLQIFALFVLGGLSACQSAPFESAPSPEPAETAANTATAPIAPKVAYSSCNVEGKYLAMTFDDGPDKNLTPKLLDLLKSKGVKATFFIVGENAANNPDIVRRIAAEGHEVGNHTWTHPQLTKLAPADLRSEIEKSSAAIKELTGKPPLILRPPYGATNTRLNNWINNEYGMKVILWSVDPLDWKYRNSARVSKELLSGAHPGGILLAHDIHATTVAAMPAVLDGLLAQGYEFVTVSELIAMDKPKEKVPSKEPESSAQSRRRGDSN